MYNIFRLFNRQIWTEQPKPVMKYFCLPVHPLVLALQAPDVKSDADVDRRYVPTEQLSPQWPHRLRHLQINGAFRGRLTLYRAQWRNTALGQTRVATGLLESTRSDSTFDPAALGVSSAIQHLDIALSLKFFIFFQDALVINTTLKYQLDWHRS